MDASFANTFENLMNEVLGHEVLGHEVLGHAPLMTAPPRRDFYFSNILNHLRLYILILTGEFNGGTV